METYTAKLTGNNYTYRLLSEGVELTTAELQTLFSTAGEAYFKVDFNGFTPSDNYRHDIYLQGSDASSGNTKHLNFGTAPNLLGDGLTYSGSWTSSIGTAGTLVQLQYKGLNSLQWAELVGKIKSAGDGKIRTLTTADYNYPTTGTKTSFAPHLAPAGVYITGESLMWITAGASSQVSIGTVLIVSKTSQNRTIVLLFNHSASGPASLSEININGVLDKQIALEVCNDLVSGTKTTSALSAAQGKVLNDNIGDLSTLTTTAKTSTVAAINELAGSIGEVAPLSGSSAPTAATEGVLGQLYTDTTGMHTYQCTAIDDTDPQNLVYTWTQRW